MEEFTKRNVAVVGASVDPLEEAKKTIERTHLTFPVAYAMDAKQFSTLTGAFYDGQKGYLHAAGFLVRPSGKLAEAVYSTGAVGRYVASDVLGLFDYITKPGH